MQNIIIRRIYLKVKDTNDGIFFVEYLSGIYLLGAGAYNKPAGSVFNLTLIFVFSPKNKEFCEKAELN